VLNRVAGFSGSVDSGDGEERITGDTAITILLPYLYREGIDYDFSGSPVNGKKYPVEHELDVLYAAGMDGIPSEWILTSHSDNASRHRIRSSNSGQRADFHQGNPVTIVARWVTTLRFRDTGGSSAQHSSCVTGQSLGSLDRAMGSVSPSISGEWYQFLMVNAA
jgi:hypothetical protein